MDATCFDQHTHTHELGHNLGANHFVADVTASSGYAHGMRYCGGSEK